MSNTQERVFANGMFVNKPHENAPNWIKGGISINIKEFFEFCKEHKREDGSIRLQFQESKAGDKWYATLDTYVGKPKEEEKDPLDDIFG